MNIFNKLVSNIIVFTTLSLSGQVFANEKISQSLPADEVTNVSIDNHSGLIKVIGWSKNKVSIEGELDDDAKGLIFEQRGAQIVIKVEYPNMDRWSADGTELTIHAPKSVRINLTGVSTNLDLTELHGGVEGKTVSGNIVATALTEHIELSSISGNIKTSSLKGKISLSAVSGDILDKGSDGRLQLQSVSGEIELTSSASEVFINNVSGNSELDLADIIELRISTVSGDVDTNLQLKDKGLVKASSVSGDLDFVFKSEVDANFRLKSSVGGDLTNKLTKDKAEQSQYGLGAKLYFQTGNGNANVSATSVSGNIKVANK